MVPKKILVAHDFSDPADRALLFAANLADKVGASLVVAHVHPDVYNSGDAPTAMPWPDPSQEERYMRFLDAEVERVVTAVLGDAGSRVERHVLRGDAAKRLVGLAEDLGADLICIGSTGKGAVERVLLGSVSQRVLRMSGIPVLTVH